MRDLRRHRSPTGTSELGVPPDSDVLSGALPEHPEAAGRERSELLLLTGSSREILARIVPGDRLALRARVARHLTERALFLEADRVLLRAFALVARKALHWRGRPALDSWLAARVDEAVDQILREDEADASGKRAADRSVPVDGALVLLSRSLALDAGALRAGCARFNHLRHEDREAFFLLAIEGRSLDRLSRERDVSAPSLARRARRALDELRGASSSPDSPDPLSFP